MTPAQFHVGEVVHYTGGDASAPKQLAVVCEVTSVDPAQYIVQMTADNSQTTCGEGENEPGSVQALS